MFDKYTLMEYTIVRKGKDSPKNQKGKDMWEARAEYSDGTTKELLFEYDENKPEADQQYEIECILIESPKENVKCTWYSVNFI